MRQYEIQILLNNTSAVPIKTVQPFVCLELAERYIVGKVRQLCGKGTIRLCEVVHGNYKIYLGRRLVATASANEARSFCS